MRHTKLCMAALIAVMSAACGEEEETEIPAVETPDSVVLEVEPEHDGTVIAAGTYPVEVVPHRSGQVYAYVHGDAPPPDDVELTVRVPVRGRSTGRPVRMRWIPRRHRYEGRVRRVDIVEGPIDVVIVVGGVEHHGHVDVCVVLPAIEVHVDHHHGKHKHKHKHKHRGRHHHHRHGHVDIHLH